MAAPTRLYAFLKRFAVETEGSSSSSGIVYGVNRLRAAVENVGRPALESRRAGI